MKCSKSVFFIFSLFLLYTHLVHDEVGHSSGKHTFFHIMPSGLTGMFNQVGNSEMQVQHTHIIRPAGRSWQLWRGLLELLERGTVNSTASETLIIPKICDVITQIIKWAEKLLTGTFALSVSPPPTEIQWWQLKKEKFVLVIRNNKITPCL